MKQFIRKCIAICMACVVVFTTMSFTVAMHFCGETLVDFSLVQQPKSCGMDEMSSSTCDSAQLARSSCCSEQQFTKQGTDDLKISYHSPTIEKLVFHAAFTYAYTNLYQGSQVQERPFIAYSPPFVKREVQILHQSFLL